MRYSVIVMISLLVEDVKNEYLCASDNDRMIGERSVCPRVLSQRKPVQDLGAGLC
jgi:hypothetical protein